MVYGPIVNSGTALGLRSGEGGTVAVAVRWDGSPSLLAAEGGPRLIDLRINRDVVSPAAKEIFRQVREALPHSRPQKA